jgi:NADPH:quinone reductase-like Zn-dependent oxidoreductase
MQMQAIALTAPDAPLALSDLPAPTPGPNEVLVRVHGPSVSPADNAIAAGMLKQMGVEYEYPVILGRDYAGVVEQAGADAPATPSATRSSAASFTRTRRSATEAGPS